MLDLDEAESRFVLYWNGKPQTHHATREEAEKFADTVRAKMPDVKIEIKNESQELDEVTGDLPFDTMLSKIVAGGNLQTLAAKIVAKIKKFPQHVENDGYERDMPRYPDGHFYGADVLNDTFDEVMQQWKKIGPNDFSDEYGEESLFDVLDGSADYTRYWDGILKLRNRLQSIPGALEQLGKMVWHGLFSGSVEQGITDIGRKGVAEGIETKIRAKNRAVVKKLQGKEVKEDITQEDIITKLKAKLGDYLSDLGQQIKKDPALKDKLAAKPKDTMGPAVKTVTTDDGQTISIHGNEDDGFRISIKNKPASAEFKTVDEATIACNMFNARRKNPRINTDYVDEA
jgi:hypothetical protein